MSANSISNVVIDSLQKDKVLSSLEARRNQWIKRLESELIKENALTIKESASGYAKKVVIAQDDEQVGVQKQELININNYLLCDAAERGQELAHKELLFRNSIVHRSVVGVCANLENYEELQSSYISMASLTKHKTYVQTREHEMLSNSMLSEQKYMRLKQPFAFKMTDAGLQLWLRDPESTGQAKEKLLRRIRESLRSLGIDLLSFYLNGELIWAQPELLGLGNGTSQDNCLDNIY